MRYILKYGWILNCSNSKLKNYVLGHITALPSSVNPASRVVVGRTAWHISDERRDRNKHACHSTFCPVMSRLKVNKLLPFYPYQILPLFFLFFWWREESGRRLTCSGASWLWTVQAGSGHCHCIWTPRWRTVHWKEHWPSISWKSGQEVVSVSGEKQSK